MRLLPSDFIIDELTIIGRNDVKKEELPYQIETISQAQIKQTNPQTAADALAANANVFVQKSQGGGGSPVLRGFEANKILLVIDGVRLNNAIYRSGHLQNAITIDPAILERMEVIFGAGSMAYGSDALGGVVHFRSRNPKLNFGDAGLKFNHNYGLRYASANRENTIHYDLNIGSKKWASLTSVSYSDFDNLKAGSWADNRYPDYGKRLNYIRQINGIDSIVANPSVYTQIGTAYSQMDLMQKILFQFSEKNKLILNGQLSTSSNIPRYDMLTETSNNGLLSFAEWNYGPQKRLLLSGQWIYSNETAVFNQLKFIGSYQKIDEDRITRRYRSDRRITQLEDISVYGLTIDFNKDLNENKLQTISYGLDLQANYLNSTAIDQDISDLSEQPTLSRYPSDKSTLRSLGGYIQYNVKNSSNTLISKTGLRYNRTSTFIKYDSADPFSWPSDFIAGLNNDNNAMVLSTGINYNPNAKWRSHFNLGNAYRAPNIDDLAKIRIKGAEVQVPNLNLKPERAISSEVGTSYFLAAKRVVTVGAFYTLLRDAIIRENFPLPDGSEFIVDGIDTLRTVANINANKGRIYGVTINTDLRLNDTWSFEGSFNYTKGTTYSEGVTAPLAHIPPFFGKLVFNYNYYDLDIKGVLRYNGAKPLDLYGGSADNPEYATDMGTLAWQTYNLYISYPYNKYFKINVGVENILDRHYRTFSSGLSAPGRNMILSVNGNF